jgi:hypothetical protein
MVKESLAKKYDIDKIYGDKAYDNNRKNFNILDSINAELAISIRKDASTRSIQWLSIKKGRSLAMKKLGYDVWKQLKDTDRRWISEIVSSSLKRVLSEEDLFQRNSNTKNRSIIESNSLQ